MRPVSSDSSGLVRFLGGLLLSSGLLLGGLCAVSLAQVTTALTPDGTLGTAGTIQISGQHVKREESRL